MKRFNVNQFHNFSLKSLQAISVAKKALAVASCEAQFYSLKKFEELGHMFICKSCPSLIAMDFRSVVRLLLVTAFRDVSSIVHVDWTLQKT
jgi:hypothetical protein